MNFDRLISRGDQRLINGRSNLKGLSSMIIKFRLVYILRMQTPYYLNTQVSRCDQKLINGRSNLKGLSPMVIKKDLFTYLVVLIFRRQTPCYVNKYIST